MATARRITGLLRRRTYRTATGKVLTDRDIRRLAAEAEAGYDVGQLPPPTLCRSTDHPGHGQPQHECERRVRTLERGGGAGQWLVAVKQDHRHEREADAAVLTAAEFRSIMQAYAALHRYGRATAAPDRTWIDLIDRAHQDLGVLWAMAIAGRIQVEGGPAAADAIAAEVLDGVL